MPTEVIPTNQHHDDDSRGPTRPIRHPDSEAYLDELARRKGVKPVHDVESMAVPGLFESDEEHDEFLRWLREERNKDLA